MFVIIFTHYVDKAILCQINNDAEYISEEVLNGFDGEVKT
jgi:hypothetical protein